MSAAEAYLHMAIMPINIRLFLISASVAQGSFKCAVRHIASTLAKE